MREESRDLHIQPGEPASGILSDSFGVKSPKEIAIRPVWRIYVSLAAAARWNLKEAAFQPKVVRTATDFWRVRLE